MDANNHVIAARPLSAAAATGAAVSVLIPSNTGLVLWHAPQPLEPLWQLRHLGPELNPSSGLNFVWRAQCRTAASWP